MDYLYTYSTGMLDICDQYTLHMAKNDILHDDIYVCIKRVPDRIICIRTIVKWALTTHNTLGSVQTQSILEF